MPPEERARFAAQRQLDAYNAHDIDAFVAAYHPDVELYNLETGALNGTGHAYLRDTYSARFESAPQLHATVVNRSVVGNFAFDQELVTGLRESLVHAMAIYEVDDDALITRVWFVVR